MKEAWIRFLNILNALRNPFKKDPVKHCDVYKKEGCAHVDGMLCDMDKCTIRKQR